MLVSLSRYNQHIAWLLTGLFYAQLVLVPVSAAASAPVRPGPTYTVPENSLATAARNMNTLTTSADPADVRPASNPRIAQPARQPESSKTAATGPDQPEMKAFSSVNNTNMVDLFTGDFSYNIPLLDVGGYPVNLSYRAGASMDEEASWAGLGWSVNPGTVNRNMRGLPDEFDGQYDSITKTQSLKENKTIGATMGAGKELSGLPLKMDLSLGLFHNNYKGWGLETGVSASINSGSSASGFLSGGLSLTNNTQEGFTVSPSVSVYTQQQEAEEKSGLTGSFTMSLPYNSRAGIKGLQLSSGLRQYRTDEKNLHSSSQTYSSGTSFSSSISFASPSFTPTISIPYTSSQYSFTARVGGLQKVYFTNLSLTGYVSKQKIEAEDTRLSLPAFGYLNYQHAKGNRNALLDFNLEKDLPYREKPPVPHIAVPTYTYDAFSITGEGTGGMFRAYRSDIGMVHDHAMRTKDKSDRAGLEVGFGDIVHAGVDVNINRAYSENGPWITNNTLRRIAGFRKDTAGFEASYFRNPGEKAMNDKNFYEALGGDDVVAVNLYQPGRSSSSIQATNYLTRYRNKRAIGNKLLRPDNVYKKERHKRSQVISYLTAREAEAAGQSRFIASYQPGIFTLDNCEEVPAEGNGTGLLGEYFGKSDFTSFVTSRIDPAINFFWDKGIPVTGVSNDNFSIRWTGRVKAPKSGTYNFKVFHDNGVRLWLNDSLLINDWQDKKPETHDFDVRLLENEFYKIRIEYYEKHAHAAITLRWTSPGGSEEIIPTACLYPPAADFIQHGSIRLEKRVNAFRKPNHISEVNVLNNDGRRYIYGLPVYNLKQHEATFSVNPALADQVTGLAGYSATDNSINNTQGIDNYYKAEDVPAYAHSFLLTGILSADYVDVSGNGISDDDLGDAVKFNYSKTAGMNNPFRWRIPYANRVSYNQGLRSDRRDDKGNYVYGEKELWYLHSIESKTMIATFVVESRQDLMMIDETGNKQANTAAKRLKEINLYTKAAFARSGTAARPIKTVHFEYNYELCPGVNQDAGQGTSGKLTLKKVWFTYNKNNKGQKNPYVFHYGSNKPYQQKAYDRWGNYKDPQQNPSSVQGVTLLNDEYPYALQDSLQAAANAAVWNLDSIALPSGGSVKVEYESDDYAFVQNRRAMQMLKPAGFGASPGATSGMRPYLHEAGVDHQYIYFSLPQPVDDKADFHRKYLQGIRKVHFRLFVQMPPDMHGSGSEYISGYGDLDPQNGYGISNNTTAWIKLSGISLKGDGPGNYSPMSKAAIQFLRLNLPSKAYPGSEPGSNLDAITAVKLLASSLQNIVTAFTSFDALARQKKWATLVDLNRSFIRLNNPDHRKYGGGHRVKRIKIYDNWDKMTGQRKAVYGQEYVYTTRKQVNGANQKISSGVASYEPGIGGEENPFRQPLEYVDKSALLGPVTLGYSEEPLGESLFPSPSVGYSKVRVRTINHSQARSANGFEETQFYTTYDFPTLTDRSVLDEHTKKRFKPALANFFRFNARHHIVLSQGFKIELNDMNGKTRRLSSFAETDQEHPISYTEYLYKTENALLDSRRLANNVTTIDPSGVIDTGGIVGKDVELMMAMREQISVNAGLNVQLNTEMFSVPFIPPFFILPSAIGVFQREENLYRSAAATKVIQRYGILDSVIHFDKGSTVTTKNLLYDGETGDVLLSRTDNEFNDPVYSFNYPSHWAYDAMGLAYKNINAVFHNVDIKEGKIIQGLSNPQQFFSSGDEVIVGGKLQTNSVANCLVEFSTFPAFTKIWAVDASVMSGGAPQIYFIDRAGKPYNGNDVSLKVIRSGRRNMLSSVGSVTSLANPLVWINNQLKLELNTERKVIQASANEFRQFWKVNDRKALRIDTSVVFQPCPPGYTFSEALNGCYKDTAAIATDTSNVCLERRDLGAYSSCGSYIYSSFSPTQAHFQRSRIDSTNLFWRNQAGECGRTVATTKFVPTGGSIAMVSGRNAITKDTSYQATQALPPGPIVFPNTGPLNRAGLWSCTVVPVNEYFGFYIRVRVPASKVYYFGFAADNQIRIGLDGQPFYQDPPGSHEENFRVWHIVPVYLTAGAHVIKLEALDSGPPEAMGFEIYNNTATEIRAATSYAQLNLIYSTKDVAGNPYPPAYSCPANYQLIQNDSSAPVCRSVVPRPSQQVISSTCVSTVKDTTLNPYTAGIAGNWRMNRSYTYFAQRAQVDPVALTNIRKDGAYADFAPFWNFSSATLVPQYNESRWVWNREMSMFNRKGFEIENKDPLGRFNAGLYGYSLTMPVAVVQNSRYRESAFEGFEDYDFGTQVCDTACAGARHTDFSSYKTKFDNQRRHSGKSSLRLQANEQASLQFQLTTEAEDNQQAAMNVQYGSFCARSQVFKEIRMSSQVLLPSFAPLKGKTMVLGAWVREDQPCTSGSYTNNSIIVAFNNTSVTLRPTGSIIEGWQRYESVFDIPADAAQITVSLRAGNSAVNFDDLRIHPYNANMKSFVFNPVNLRLMAELDENNYATFYEYDDDGTLVRLKKETQRGIKMIRETRSALLKE